MSGITHTFVSGKTDDSDASLVRPTDWNAEHTVGAIRAGTAVWWHEYHYPATSVSKGASGATLVVPGANSTGGYTISNVAHYLYFQSHMHDDWDAASDPIIEINFEVNTNNTGGADTDTVDLKLITYIKGDLETAIKSQTLEVATVVGKSAQYKQFHVEFTLDYDDGTNPVHASDIVGMRLNLETDTSEVDNVIINHMVFKYKTFQVSAEV